MRTKTAASDIVRTTDTRPDRPLSPTFLPRAVEREPIPEVEVEETHIDDIMVAQDEYMQLPANVRQLMNLNQFMIQW